MAVDRCPDAERAAHILDGDATGGATGPAYRTGLRADLTDGLHVQG
jgi:hypothetical protein